jgi:hypothetical protein
MTGARRTLYLDRIAVAVPVPFFEPLRDTGRALRRWCPMTRVAERALALAEWGVRHGGALRKPVRRAFGRVHEAWNSPAMTSDTAMNIPPAVVDLGSLAAVERTYHDAVEAHLRRLARRYLRP